MTWSIGHRNYFVRRKWQVIITAQMIFGRAVLDYEWPTSAKARTVTVASKPAGLTVYYDDQVQYSQNVKLLSC